MKIILWNLWANESLIMVCLQVYWELLSRATFLQVHSNSEEVSYLSWQNTYPNLKTTCHIKLKFFLWTKLLENLLLAKYLISLAATLKVRNFEFPISNSVTNKEYSYGKSMEKICIKRIKVYEMLWHHFYNLKNVKKTPMEGCYFWKSCWLQHTPPCVFFKLCKWYQIAQSIT